MSKKPEADPPTTPRGSIISRKIDIERSAKSKRLAARSAATELDLERDKAAVKKAEAARKAKLRKEAEADERQAEKDKWAAKAFEDDAADRRDRVIEIRARKLREAEERNRVAKEKLAAAQARAGAHHSTEPSSSSSMVSARHSTVARGSVSAPPPLPTEEEAEAKPVQRITSLDLWNWAKVGAPRDRPVVEMQKLREYTVQQLTV